MEITHSFLFRLLLLLCLVLGIVVDGISGIEKRDVHRIILKSSRRPKHHSRHIPEKNHKKHSHRGHKHEDNDDSFGSAEEERHENQGKHRKNKSRHHYRSHDQDSNKYVSSEESYEETYQKPEIFETHRHKSVKNHVEPQLYVHTAPAETKWAPIINTETLHLSPPPLPYESESLLINQAHHENIMNNIPFKIELTTAFPYNLPTIYGSSDYNNNAKNVFYTFDPKTVDLTHSSGAELSSRLVKSGLNKKNNSYEVREDHDEDRNVKVRKHVFKILAPALDIAQLAEESGESDENKPKDEEKAKKERKRVTRFRGSTRANRAKSRN